MFLITEEIKDVKFSLVEDSGKKRLYIEGVFLQGNIKNRNGRIYPIHILENEVNRYNEENIKMGRAYGELGHPTGPQINLDRVSHMIRSLRKEGTDFIGKAEIVDTPNGNIAKALIESGANLGVSTRGLGSLKTNGLGIDEVQNDFRLATAADIVAEPSAPSAFVKGIMEGVQWFYDEANRNWKQAQLIEQTKKMNKDELNRNAVQLFEKFVSNLRRK